MWAKPIPRHIRFHDTRHSFGTAVVRGAGTAVAHEALRHPDIRLTIHSYGHLDDRDLREGVRMAFRGRNQAGHPGEAGRADCKELQTAPEGSKEAGSAGARPAADQKEGPATPKESRGRLQVGETGLEPD